MSEPRVRYEATPAPGPRDPARAVTVVLPFDWAQAVIRLQQLHNLGYTRVRLAQDDRGVRIEPDG